jgi:cytochrome c biogenesis protein CcdA
MMHIFQAFGAGVTGAIGAPMLPLMPALIAWAWVAARDSAGPVATTAIGFAASFALGFAALNAPDSALVAMADPGAVLAGIAIAAYGLHALGAVRVPGARLAAAPLGFAFAFGWTPLPSAALAAAVDHGFAASAAYGAGAVFFAWLAIPILSGVLRGKSSRTDAPPRMIAKLAGMTLFATGLAIAGGFLAEAGFALDEYFPALRTLG